MAVDAASVAFILISMALVNLMTPGLAFFYGGLLPQNSVLTMMGQVMVPMGIISALWYVFLFSLCFGETWHFIGNPWTYFFTMNTNVNEPLTKNGEIVVDGIPGLLFCAYQGMFAVITPSLMTGAFANRFRFKAYLIFITIWMLVVYAPFCHWVWGGGWLAEWGVWDFAGGIVVHISAGFSALASLLVVGKRSESDKQASEPHNIPFVALGTALLWFGWFGFNGGSALGSSGVAVAAAVNSEIAGSLALMVWCLLDWIRFGRPKVVGMCVGAIAGLATVTPAAGFIQPWAAFVLGIVAAGVCYICVEVANKAGFDDALDVWGVHGMGGFMGTILLGVLADGSECDNTEDPAQPIPGYCVNPNTITRSGEQFGKQLVAAVICAVYSFVVTFVILKLLNLIVALKPIAGDINLDELEHGERAYTPDKEYTKPPQPADVQARLMNLEAMLKELGSAGANGKSQRTEAL